jgi:hypothetical protein
MMDKIVTNEGISVDKLQQSCIDMTSNVIDDIAFREALYATKASIHNA